METNKTNLWKAMLEVEKEISILKKDESNPFYKSEYLSLPGLVKELTPVTVKNGLVVSQHPVGIGKVKTIVAHAESGERISSTLELPIKDQTPQGAGSAITYARRYALMAIFNIASEDDDGNSSSGKVETKSFKPTGKSPIMKCPSCGNEHQGQYPKCLDCFKSGKPVAPKTKKIINEDLPPFEPPY